MRCADRRRRYYRIAERLTRQNLNVVVIDRELRGRGSTAASTSVLLWEIDRSTWLLKLAWCPRNISS
jgi:hypothetical protein